MKVRFTPSARDHFLSALGFIRQQNPHATGLPPGILSRTRNIFMGHYCRICGRIRPNEKFSGKGHRTHVCRQCALMPKEVCENIEQQHEIAGFLLRQSHISKKNLDRLKILMASPNPATARFAELVLEVATIAPYRRHRFKILAAQNKALLKRLEEAGSWPGYYEVSCAEDKDDFSFDV